jgi:hypothetical protein
MYFLDDIVKQYCLETGDSTLQNYVRYYNFAVRGVRELNRDVLYTMKTVNLTVNQNTLTALLPVDYVDYLRIGTVYQGRIVPFGVNNDLAFNRTYDSCGNIQAYQNWPYNTVEPLSGISWGGFNMFTPHTINGQNMGGYFGIGGGNNGFGYYRIDTERGVIQFASAWDIETVYFEYLVDVSSDAQGRVEVHDYEYEAILAYVAWRHAQNNQSQTFGLGEKRNRRQEYYNQRDLAKMRRSRFTMEEAYQAIRKSTKLSPKI